MKFIFDFDDVLFHTSKKFIEHQHSTLEKSGIPRERVNQYYEKERLNLFSLKKMLAHFSKKEDLYEKVMSESKNFINSELFELLKKLGKSNCYIVTYGDRDYQMDKIEKSELSHLFSKIIVVQGSKKEAVEKICAKNKDEKVIFIDDKAKHFEDLDFKKYPNLKTILYDEKGLEKVKAEIKKEKF